MQFADPDRLSLCHGTFADLPAPAFVSAAHQAGFSRVSVRLATPSDENGRYRANAFGRDVQAEVRSLLQSREMSLEEVEYAMLTPASTASDFDPLLEGGAAMGASDVVTICYGFEHEPDLIEKFAGFCERARAFRLGVLLEFIAISSVPSLEAAIRIVTASAAGARITIDILHLIRSGGRVSDIANHDPALLGMGQLCDGPLAGPAGVAAQRQEMRDERRPLGEGEFPLRDFVVAMPPHAPLGIEILRLAQERDLATAVEEASMMRQSAIRLLSESAPT